MAPDLYKYFRVEARQLVDELSRGALDLEKGGASAELTPRLLRLAHTLKGAARVVKQGEIARLAHAVEDALSGPNEGVGQIDSPPREKVDSILKLLDQISILLVALGEQPLEAAAPGDSVRAGTSLSPSPSETTETGETGDLDSVISGISETMAQLRAMDSWRSSAESAKRMVDLLASQLATPRSSGRANSPITLAEDLRTEVGRLEGNLSRSLDLIYRELRQVLDAAERMRLLPVRALFGTLERVARDAGRELRRQVAFHVWEIGGGDLRLDAAMLAPLQAALIQLVRNAVAHGIEDDGERRKMGKSLPGKIELRIERRGDRLFFLCRDDGRGIDVAAVRRSAQTRGLLDSSDDADAEKIFQLLLKGGLSTAGQITEVAGRGIGLDVVRESMERLGGQATVRSKAGEGTEFELALPISLAALEALIVQSGMRRVAIPLNSVRRALHLSPKEFSQASAPAQGETVFYEGKAVPWTSLSELFGGEVIAERPLSAVVVSNGKELVALGVDRILDAADIVVRPLPLLMPNHVAAAGAYLDADGNVQLVLNTDRLVASTRRRGKALLPQAIQRLPILVVDDSLTTRMLEQSILESAGYEVDLASSAEEALGMADRRSYGLFLVDVEMPGMNGFSFVERTRGDANLGKVPAILVTSRDAPEDRQRGREVGALSYFVKSEFDQGKLLEIVRRTVG